MPWKPAEQYKALIGGILYRNVTQPIICNGKSLISLTRHTKSNQLAVSFELLQHDRAPIATVTNNTVTLNNTSDYLVLQGLNRTVVAHQQSGRIWCDIQLTPSNDHYELSVSCLFFDPSGYPVVPHPDRSKFGTANDNKPPNMAFLTLTTEPRSRAGAISLKNSPLYLLGIVIENFHSGITITIEEPNDPK